LRAVSRRSGYAAFTATKPDNRNARYRGRVGAYLERITAGRIFVSGDRTLGSGFVLDHAAVERAQHKGLAEASFEAEADERCAVKLPHSIVTLDRAL